MFIPKCKHIFIFYFLDTAEKVLRPDIYTFKMKEMLFEILVFVISLVVVSKKTQQHLML